jgi:chitinase
MLIWAIDQDTDDLQALKGLLGENNLKLFQREAENAGDWEVSTKKGLLSADELY